MAHGLQIYDASGNTILDTSTFTVKDRELYVNSSVTAAATISIPTATLDSVVSIKSNVGPNAPIPSAVLSGTSLAITGSGFNASIRVVDYR